MADTKPSRRILTTKNNNLSSAQEVEYTQVFKKADKAARIQSPQ